MTPKPKRIVKHGAPTNDLVFSASADGNERVFPRILDLLSSARWMSLSDRPWRNADRENRGMKTKASGPGGGAPKP